MRAPLTLNYGARRASVLIVVLWASLGLVSVALLFGHSMALHAGMGPKFHRGLFRSLRPLFFRPAAGGDSLGSGAVGGLHVLVGQPQDRFIDSAVKRLKKVLGP